jgi:hypothetical protein
MELRPPEKKAVQVGGVAVQARVGNAGVVEDFSLVNGQDAHARRSLKLEGRPLERQLNAVYTDGEIGPRPLP